MNFIRGVVDSDNLPLNVSREILQQSKTLKVIKKKLVRKALEMVADLQSDEEKYNAFLKEFGANLKYGIIEDPANRSRIAKLCRFHSSKSVDGKMRSLDDYVASMKTGQQYIYYVAGEKLEDLQKSPFIERLLKRGYEVLYFVDPIDEYAIQNMPNFSGKKLMSASKDGLKFTEEDDKADTEATKKQEETLADLMKWFKTTLGDKIAAVKVSPRLRKSPCVLVTGQYGYSANMERIIKNQALGADREMRSAGKTLEINPVHPIIIALDKEIRENPESAAAKENAFLMFDTALLNSGFSVDNTAEFVDRINRILKLSLHLDESAEAPDEPARSEEAPKEAASSDTKTEAATEASPEKTEEKEL